MAIKITQKDLKKAQDLGIINSSQSQALWQFLNKQKNASSTYNFPNLMYFLGGFIAIAAITLFLGSVFLKLGEWGLFAIASIYWVIGLGAAKIFNSKHLKTPQDICLLFVTSITPLLIFSILTLLNVWQTSTPLHALNLVEFLDWHSLLIEIGTLIVACVLFFLAPSSLLMLPITLCGWVIAVNLPEHLNIDSTLVDNSNFSCLFGLVCTLLAIYLDSSLQKRKYCYWPYVIGVSAFWFGLIGSLINNEINLLLFCLINIVLLILGVMFGRKIVLIYGGLGVSYYLGHLAYDIFHDSIYWPFILSLIGIAIILCGVLLQKSKLPKSLKDYIKSKKQNDINERL